MTLRCPVCRRTDDRWSLVIEQLAHADGTASDVWRHRPCRRLLAVPAAVAVRV